MSGIVGSRLNIRGSGLVGSLGTDGQVFTSSGAGAGAVYEAAAAGGKLLQVVQSAVKTVASTTSSSYADISGATVSITPSATSSKVLVFFDFGTLNNGALDSIRIKLFRDTTLIRHSTQFCYSTLTGWNSGMGAFNFTYLDSPSTTSEVVYKLQWAVEISGSLFANYDGAGGEAGMVSIAQEIGA